MDANCTVSTDAVFFLLKTNNFNAFSEVSRGRTAVLTVTRKVMLLLLLVSRPSLLIWSLHPCHLPWAQERGFAALYLHQPPPPPPTSKMGRLMGRLCSPNCQTRAKDSTRGMGQCNGRSELGRRWAGRWALPPLGPCTFHCPSPPSQLKSLCCS